MKALITGGAGFIGSHLTELLLHQGNSVVVLDDLSSGSLANLSAVIDHPRLHVLEGSVLDADLVDKAASGVQTVFHLAAAVGTFTIMRDPLAGLRTNLHGTEIVLDSAVRHRARILVASTSEVYGKNTKEGLREDDDRVMGSPLKRRWSYAEAKAIDETMARIYFESQGLGVVIVRLFNTVGPRQTGRYGMVVPRFVAQALAGQPLSIYGTGQQSRCFCHVRDVVPALAALADCEAALGQAVNLGNPEQISIQGLADLVVTATESSSGREYVPYETAYGAGFEDMLRRVPDIGFATSLIGFSPRRGLRQIVADVAEYQQATAHELVAGH